MSVVGDDDDACTLALRPRRRLTPLGRALVVTAAVAAVAAVALRLPAAVAVAAPAALALLVDVLWFTPTPVRVRIALAPARLLEGERVGVTVTARADRPSRVALTLATGPRLSQDTPSGWAALDVGPAGAVAAGTWRARRWGAAHVGPLTARWVAPLGCLGDTATAATPLTVRIHPAPAALRRLARPRQTMPWAGTQPAARGGAGLEFAEIRRFAPGDRRRDVNWRVTRRRGEIVVNARHPERTVDVAVVLDAFEPEWIDAVVRVGVTLTEAYLANRDRVGVVGLGGLLRWIPPGAGERHRRRLVDALIETRSVWSWARPGVDAVAPLAVPPHALVLAVTALGEEMTDALLRLRARGRDVVVLDVAAGPDPAGPRPGPTAATPTVDALAQRLAVLERRADAERLRARGAVVVPLTGPDALDRALVTVTRLRRRIGAPR